MEGLESSEDDGGGDDDGREELSTSEQNEPDREVSVDELNPFLPVEEDMLKYLLSCRTAPAISLCLSGVKVQVSLLL